MILSTILCVGLPVPDVNGAYASEKKFKFAFIKHFDFAQRHNLVEAIPTKVAFLSWSSGKRQNRAYLKAFICSSTLETNRHFMIKSMYSFLFSLVTWKSWINFHPKRLRLSISSTSILLPLVLSSLTIFSPNLSSSTCKFNYVAMTNNVNTKGLPQM